MWYVNLFFSVIEYHLFKRLQTRWLQTLWQKYLFLLEENKASFQTALNKNIVPYALLWETVKFNKGKPGTLIKNKMCKDPDSKDNTNCRILFLSMQLMYIYPIATLKFSTKWTVVFLLIINFLIASFLPTQNRKRPHMYLELTMFWKKR